MFRQALAVVALALCSTLHATPGDPEQKAPFAGAKPLEVLAWKSKAGLRYTWVLPKDYDGKTPRNLTVILHGTGLDYRWGHGNNKPGVFRPDDVVVSVDGTSPGQGESRLFLGEPKDAAAFAEFLAEMRTTFVVDRVFLYGHSQGGFFVVYYAGERPETVAGVVAHASGAWNWSKMPAAAKKVAIAFMHGSSDPVVAYGQSPGSRDVYADKGFELLHLRRLDGYNHLPNAVRATETLDWCQGMTAATPEEALACALRLLTAKPADEYQWETVPGFAGARDVLRRLAGQGPAPFKSVADDVAASAKRWTAAIESHAALHVAKLEKALGKKGELVIDAKPPLGHLIPLREDFRGVDAVETFVKSSGFDKRVAAQAKEMKTFWEAWSSSKPPEEVARAVLEALAKCCLLDAFPAELGEKLDAWKGQGLKLGGKLTFANYDAWSAAWRDGRKDYAKLWREWKGPEPARKKH